MKVSAMHIGDIYPVEHGARNCYDSFSKLGTNPKFIPNLIQKAHLGVLEHSSATFFIEDISRACSHQLVRHRHFSFLQRSQRYCPEEQFEYVIPTAALNDPALCAVYTTMMEQIANMYSDLRKAGLRKEDARMVLPNACTTSIQVSGNLRTWLEFLQKRLIKAAQWEIRELANHIYIQLNKAHPDIFNETTVGFPIK